MRQEAFFGVLAILFQHCLRNFSFLVGLFVAGLSRLLVVFRRELVVFFLQICELLLERRIASCTSRFFQDGQIFLSLDQIEDERIRPRQDERQEQRESCQVEIAFGQELARTVVVFASHRLRDGTALFAQPGAFAVDFEHVVDGVYEQQGDENERDLQIKSLAVSGPVSLEREMD